MEARFVRPVLSGGQLQTRMELEEMFCKCLPQWRGHLHCGFRVAMAYSRPALRNTVVRPVGIRQKVLNCGVDATPPASVVVASYREPGQSRIAATLPQSSVRLVRPAPSAASSCSGGDYDALRSKNGEAAVEGLLEIECRL